MGTNAKLFRAIVILGASLTAGACDEHGKSPGDGGSSNDGRIISADAKPPGDGGPVDAVEADVILIL